MQEHKARIRCECGNDVQFDDADSQVECRCGAVYAVTVTQLVSPERE